MADTARPTMMLPRTSTWRGTGSEHARKEDYEKKIQLLNQCSATQHNSWICSQYGPFRLCGYQKPNFRHQNRAEGQNLHLVSFSSIKFGASKPQI